MFVTKKAIEGMNICFNFLVKSSKYGKTKKDGPFKCWYFWYFPHFVCKFLNYLGYVYFFKCLFIFKCAKLNVYCVLFFDLKPFT